jgi:hypothetical protein
MSSNRSRALVAVLALLLGTSLVAGTAYAAPLTAKQVKKIAAKVVKNQAPKLSVKSAKTADSAKTAGTAGNALNLGGRPASFYLDTLAQSTTTNATDVGVNSTVQVLNPAVLDVPAGVSVVRVDASVVVNPVGSAGVDLWVSQGVCVNAGADYNYRSSVNNADETSISITRVYDVTPGTVGFRLCARTADGSEVGNRTLVAQMVNLEN